MIMGKEEGLLKKYQNGPLNSTELLVYRRTYNSVIICQSYTTLSRDTQV